MTPRTSMGAGSPVERLSPHPGERTVPFEAMAESAQVRKRLPIRPFPVTWTSELAGQQVPVPGGYATAIAVDASGTVHVVYWDCVLGRLLHVAKVAGAWAAPEVIDTVNPPGSQGGYFHVWLAMDPAGNVHVSYFNHRNGDLKHAWQVSGAWSVEVVQPGVGYSYAYSALAIEPTGIVHLLYTNTVQGMPSSLRYVARTQAGWSSPVDVDPGSPGAGSTALAIDSKGNLHAVCSTVSSVKYFRRLVGNAWQMSHVIESRTGGPGFCWTAMTVDAEDALHVSYFDIANRCVRYAMKGAGVAWQPSTTLFSNVDFGMSSIAANARSIAVVLYNSSDLALQILWKTSHVWEPPQVIDAVHDSGAYCHVAMDVHGSPHVSYFRTVGATSLNPGFTTVHHAYLALLPRPT